MSGKSNFEVSLRRLNELLNSGTASVQLLVLQYKNAQKMAEMEGSKNSKKQLAESGKKLIVPVVDEISRCLGDEEKGLEKAAWLAIQVVALWTTADLGGQYEGLSDKVLTGLEESLQKTSDDLLVRACLWYSIAKMLLYTGVSKENERVIAAKKTLKSGMVGKAHEYLDIGGEENIKRAAWFGEQAAWLSIFALPGEDYEQGGYDDAVHRLEQRLEALL